MAKKTYTKPTIERVELKPEEAALTACKISTSIGPHPSGRHPCNQGAGCVLLTS